jgi:hypothetical protein
MASKMQNPGVQAGGLVTHSNGSSPAYLTASDLQRQTLIARFCLSPSLAQDVSRLCFGEARHD